MLINLTEFVKQKKGLRKNFARSYLAENGFLVNQSNFDKLLKANEKNVFPHVDLFIAGRFIPEMRDEKVRDQIVEQTYLMLDELEEEIDVVVPEDLERHDGKLETESK